MEPPPEAIPQLHADLAAWFRALRCVCAMAGGPMGGGSGRRLPDGAAFVIGLQRAGALRQPAARSTQHAISTSAGFNRHTFDRVPPRPRLLTVMPRVNCVNDAMWSICRASSKTALGPTSNPHPRGTLCAHRRVKSPTPCGPFWSLPARPVPGPKPPACCGGRSSR